VAVVVTGGLALQAVLGTVSAREPAGQALQLRRLEADLAARERRAVAARDRASAPKLQDLEREARRRTAAHRPDPIGRSRLKPLWDAYPL